MQVDEKCSAPCVVRAWLTVHEYTERILYMIKKH